MQISGIYLARSGVTPNPLDLAGMGFCGTISVRVDRGSNGVDWIRGFLIPCHPDAPEDEDADGQKGYANYNTGGRIRLMEAIQGECS